MLTDYQQYIAKSRYARYIPELKRRETWDETVTRYVEFISSSFPETFNKDEIKEYILNLKVMPSMRALMTAGKALERDNAAGYNCSYLAIDDQRAFDEAMYLLMNGVGVGYSVERQFISKLPFVSEDFFESDSTIVVRDSKIGWSSALKELVSLLYQGLIPKWDMSNLRPAGAPLKTFGGRSSGPAPLNDLFNFFVFTFKNASGRKLNSIECNDLMCKIGETIVVGGVRRSACICLSNLSDVRMRTAKSGQWWLDNAQRALANISVAYTEKPDIGQFMEEWLSLYNSKSGERGIFNRVAAVKKIKDNGRRKAEPIQESGGINPCLTGETLVYVADGRGTISIKELANEGKDVNVFCFDNKGNIVVRTMRNPRITNENATVYKITLDDGSVIRTTENHKFLTKEGCYKEVKDLIVGESLNIITKFEASIKDIFHNENSNSQDYWWINNDSKIKLEHRIIAENHYESNIPKGYVVHHKDFCAKNNNPSNLIVMSKTDHDALHGDNMRGENNPMFRAKTEWSEEKWDSYRKNMSNAVSGEKNANYCGFTNEDIRSHAMFLTEKLGRRFSINDWVEYATEYNLPKSFSKWREDHHGGIIGLAKSCALELGYDHINCDPRIVKHYKEAVDAGYNAFIDNDKILIIKKCEVCGEEFITSYKRREHGICSLSCSSKRNWENENTRKIYLDSIKIRNDFSKIEKRNNQIKIYLDLKFKIGRQPKKSEWLESCKEHNISSEISRKSSPFKSYNELIDEASMYNHKILSIEFDGYETVYNGTVDEYHNFFVGAFEGNNTSGKKTVSFLNNLQCGEIVLRSSQFCNLSEVIIRPEDTLEDILDKVRIATIIGTHQGTFTNFRYLRSIWKKNTEEERLLGVSLTGVMDHEVFSGKKGYDILAEWLSTMKEVAIDVNTKLCEKLGINQAVAITTVKPSGCTTLETKIKTNEGIKSMAEIFSELTEENIFEKQPHTWIKPSKDLYVFDENNTNKKITNLFINGMSEVYEIEDESGNIYKFTGEHKLKTTDGWKRVDELTENDDIISF
jgi:intein/homing endonuclease